MDFARGFAVLGILLANLEWFASSMFSTAPLAPPDDPLMLGILAFVNGKFRSLLAILFGAGLAMQFQKRQGEADAWPFGYLKRTFWLGVIGLFHGYVIWSGDILYLYAWTAFFACWAMTWPRKVLKWLVGIWLAILIATAIGGGIYAYLQPVTQAAEVAASATDEFEQFMSVAQHRRPSFATRGVITSVLVLLAPFATIFFIPLFWLGILLSQNGVLLQPSAHPKTRNWMLLLGFGVGLPLNLLPALRGASSSAFEGVAEFASGPLLAIGYLILAAIVAERFRDAKPVLWLSRVGQASLTVYLLQSIFATLLLERPGIFGSLKLPELLAYAVVIWALAISCALTWLHFFRLGPAEWLLRSLTEGRRLPIRRVAVGR